jgi:hypothetical protein
VRACAPAGRGRLDPPAIALHLGLPVWSNDSDFEIGGVDWHTTAEVLKALGVHAE